MQNGDRSLVVKLRSGLCPRGKAGGLSDISRCLRGVLGSLTGVSGVTGDIRGLFRSASKVSGTDPLKRPSNLLKFQGVPGLGSHGRFRGILGRFRGVSGVT